MEEEGRRVQHLVMVPMAAMGHLISTVELAKLILSLSTATTLRFTITVIIIPPSVPNPELSSFLSSTSVPNLSFLHLPPISLNLPPFSSVLLDHYKPHVKSAIQTLASSSTSPVTALVLDMFCRNMIDLGLELGIPPYVFFTSSASFLGFVLLFPTAMDPLIPDDRKAVDLKDETASFHGFSSKLPVSAWPDVIFHGKTEMKRVFVDLGLCLRKACGFLVNSFDGLQRGAVKALEEGLYLPPELHTPPVYNIGPLLSLKPADQNHECITWLDRQPEGSVVYLCFGSRGSFPDDQLREIADGLEKSGHRFLWVVRAPPKEGQFGRMRDAVLEEVLPDGFSERTKERGLVWPSFAPQTEILGHSAVGGFVTHCGWNSFLEGVWFGVPMAAWPLYAEQHFNAFEMAEEIGVGVRMRIDRMRGNWASSEEVERAVRLLMGEGSEAVKEKVRELREEGRRAVEVGGSSYRALLRVAEHWSEDVGSSLVR